MQELKNEMNGRIGTLEKSIARDATLRDELLEQADEISQQIEDKKKLIAQYREGLQRLAVSITYS